MRSRRLLLLSLTGLAFAQSGSVPAVIDGDLRDDIWTRTKPGQLTPAEPGVRIDDGGEVRSILSGRYLYISAKLREPSGRFTARSIGKNPRWEEEDIVTFVLRIANENDWMLQVGPLGAYSVKWRWTGEPDWYLSRPERSAGFLVAARMGEGEWRAEAAIPLVELGSPGRGEIHLSVERVRAARPGAPAQHWHWPGGQAMAEIPGSPTPDASVPDPIFKPSADGNTEPPIEVGRRRTIAPLESNWTDDAWGHVPAWRLNRNEPAARAPEFQTEIRMMHSGNTLAVIARCAEPSEPVAKARERDGGVDHDDSFHIYLATSGSSYVKYVVNAAGFVQDASGSSGGPRISRPSIEWSSPVRALAWRGRGEWIARLDVPLDFVASALGEQSAPRTWKILLMRYRARRVGEPAETSVLPVTESITPYCPARYRRLILVDADPSQLKESNFNASSRKIGVPSTRVLSDEQRTRMAIPEMLDRNIHNRVLKVLETERRDWENVRTLRDWEAFREPRRRALSASLGDFPPRQPLNTRVIKEYRGEGYRRQDLVYQSQPGLWVPANFYLPLDHKDGMPGIVIAHSLHAAKSQFELQDMGILWARAGCAVVVIDQIGYGERAEGYPWGREFYHSRYVTGMQLYTVDESLIKWMVWDIMRAIDLLVERKDVDDKRIILLGAVAGGGDPAAVAAALDDRVSGVVPFNFGESTPEIPRFIPEKNQWPLELADPGLGDWETPRCLRRGIIDQFLQWTICAMMAPRKFVYSFELGWNVEDLPAWARYKKVYDLYHARDNLADAHGFGPFPGPGECWNIGPAQRRSLYPTLERWYGIPIPFEPVDPSVRSNLTELHSDRRPEAELAVLNPAIASELHMRTAHELARDIGQSRVASARARLAQMDRSARQEWMRSELAKRLGDIEPTVRAKAKINWSKKLPNSIVEGITIDVEPDLTVPFLLIRPVSSRRVPVVVGVAEGGKDLFWTTRSEEIEALLKRGVAVCLPDVRGTGETSPDGRRDADNDENVQAVNEEMLGETLVGRRLKDLRTVLKYLEQRPDLDSKRLALWGESLIPVNTGTPALDELPHWQVGSTVQHQGEPLGGLLAVLAALYDSNVKAIAVRNGLVGYSSILDSAFFYVPADITIPSFLEVGDIEDVEAALAPRPMILEDLVDGKNRRISTENIRQELAPVLHAYREMPANLTVVSGDASRVVAWLLASL